MTHAARIVYSRFSDETSGSGAGRECDVDGGRAIHRAVLFHASFQSEFEADSKIDTLVVHVVLETALVVVHVQVTIAEVARHGLVEIVLGARERLPRIVRADTESAVVG